MKRNTRWLLGIAGTLLICLAYLFVKLRYLGWEHHRVGSAGGYSVVAYKTMHLPDPMALLASEADGGYYRIFDNRGRKVHEVFSANLQFDVVSTSSQGVEFQLEDGSTHFWRVPRP